MNDPKALESFCNRHLSVITELTLKDLSLDRLKQDKPEHYIQLALLLELYRRYPQQPIAETPKPALLSQKQLLLFTGLTALTVSVIITLLGLSVTWYVGYQTGSQVECKVK